MIKRYLFNILIAIDQMVNAIFFGNPDETISSRCGKRLEKKHCYVICRALHILEKKHCEKSIEVDEN